MINLVPVDGHELPGLAERLKTAQREREVWYEGRDAYKTFGRTTPNPYFLSTQEHDLWADGFAVEEDEAKRHAQKIASRMPLMSARVIRLASTR